MARHDDLSQLETLWRRRGIVSVDTRNSIFSALALLAAIAVTALVVVACAVAIVALIQAVT
jgi:hypothetical protein